MQGIPTITLFIGSAENAVKAAERADIARKFEYFDFSDGPAIRFWI